MKRFKNLSLVLALAMVLQILVPVNFAYAAANKTDDIIFNAVITITDPVTNKEIEPVGGIYNDVPKNAKINIRFEFELPDGDDYEFEKDDYFEIKFPEEIKFKDISEKKFKSDKIDVILKLEDNTATVTIDRIAVSEITGFFEVDGTFVESLVSGGKVTEIDLGYEGGIIRIGFKEPPKPDVNMGIAKNGEYNHLDDTILWTVTLSTPSAIAYDVTVKDILITANHEYVEDSFKVNGVTTSAAITGSALSYTFPYPVDSEQTITYRTKPIAGAFTVEDGKVTFKNKAELHLDGKLKGSSPGTVDLDWINKSDGTLSDVGGVTRIKWTVTVKNHGDKLKNTNNTNNTNNARIEDIIGAGLSLVENNITIQFDGNSPVTLTTGDNDIGKYSYSGNKLTYHFGNQDFKTAVLTYYTDILNPNDNLNNNDTITFNNTADLLWDNGTLGSPSDTSKATIGAGGLLDKRGQSSFVYINGETEEITWTVDINKNRLTIDNAVFTDEIPAGLEFIEGSFSLLYGDVVSGDVVSYEGLTVTGSSIKYKFDGTINSKHTIIYKTKILDSHKELFTKGGDGNNSIIFKNSAVLIGEIDEVVKKFEDHYKQNVKSQVISKSVLKDAAGIDYNYETGKVKWQIVINKSKLPLKNAVLTDTIPEGMSYVDGTFNITPTPAAIEGRGFKIEGNVITYEFPEEITDEYIVTFETLVSKEFLLHEERLNEVVSFENKSVLKSDGLGEAKSNATVSVNNYVIEKEKDSLSEAQDYIAWSVPINAGRVTLSNIEISDTLQDELELDLSSVKLYKANIDPKSGKLAKYGNALSTALYDITYEDNVFIFKLNGMTSESYILEFGTDVLVSKATIKNTVKFNGSGLNTEATEEAFSVSVDEQKLGASGQTGSLKIIKIDDDTGKEIVFDSARFKIYRIFNSNVKDEKSAVTVEGDVLFDELLYKTYYIEEVIPPDGYLRDDDVHSARISGDDRNVEYIFRNKKALSDIILIKLDEEGWALEDAEFKLTKNGESDWEPIIAKSDEDGKVTFENIELGNYTIEETKSPAGYVKLSEKIHVSVEYNEDKTATVVKFIDISEGMNLDDDGTLNVTNKLVDVAGTIELLKKGIAKNKDNSILFDVALAGAKFALYTYEEGVAGEEPVDSKISQADGSVIFTDIPLGTYVVIETEAPYGYAKSDLEVFVNVFRNPDKLDEALVEYSFENDAEFASELLTVENQKLFADIDFTKVDEGGKKGLAGAKFKLTKDSDSNWGSKFAESDENGKVIFEHIELGKYTIEETEPPTGYVKLTDMIQVIVDYNEDKTAAVVTFTINDEGMQLEDDNVYVGNELVDIYADAKLIKNGAAENIKGETLYTKALKDAKFDIYLLSENGESHFDSSTSEENGSVTFSKLPIGNYVIRETESPSGYLKTNEEVFVKVYRNPENLGEALVDYTVGETKYSEPTVVNKSINIEFIKTDKSGNPLAGAEFTLYDSDENEIEGFEPVTSNEFGEVIFTAVPEGSYIIKETKAPNGYREYNKKISAEVIVTENEAVVNFLIDGEEVELEDGVLTVENERKPGGGSETPVYGKIAIKKVDENKKVLQGAEFTLYDSNGKVVGKAVSGKDGIVSFENLEKGNYVIKETKAPDGYVFEVNETEVEIKGSETKTYTFTNKKEEPKKPGRIEIIKTDEEGNLLSDARFSLIDEKGSTLQNVVTVNGRAAFEDVPAGRYTVKEVQAPAGYELSEKTVSVTVGSEETITVKFVNKLSGVPVVPVSGRITINKVDENNMALSGAEFTLYNENNEVMGTAVSDENGRVIFENLKDGKYFVRETKAPEGYEIVTDVLNVDVAQGKSYSYRFRNIPSSEIIRDPNVPKGWETIEDPDVPADTVPTLPDTGSFLNTWMLAVIGFMLILTGIILYKRRMLRN